VVEIPIPNPLITEVLVASDAHIPRVRTNTGFSLIKPFVNVFISYPP
jgi:hypothetical protein